MLEIRHLKKDWEGLSVIEDLSLSVGDHEIVALVGPSGCGKSTVLNLVAGIAGNYGGEIENHAEKTGYVFQEDRILPWLNVYDNIRIVREKEDRGRIESLIAQVKLTGFERYLPDQLSGGMRQRCGIARAFYFGSRLLLMDEPFKSLDYHLRLEMLALLVELWKKERNSVMFVTHDMEEALMIADRVIVLRGRPTGVGKELTLSRSLPEQGGLRDMSTDEMVRLKAELIALTA